MQILLGAFISTMLVAGGITSSVWVLQLRFPELSGLMRISFAELFWRCEAVATVVLLGGFVMSRSALWICLWWSVGVVAIVSFVTRGMWIGPTQLGALTLLAWTIFAVHYVRTRVIARPLQWTHVPASVTRLASLPSSPAAVMSVLLTEQLRETTRILTGFIVVAIVCIGALLLPALSSRGFVTWREHLAHAFPLALAYIIGSTFENSSLAARARRLWLHGGLDRRELFGTCEKLAWRGLAYSLVPVAALMALCWWLTPQNLLMNVSWLIVNLAVAPSTLYFCLMLTRGWRWPEIVFGIVLSVTWLALLFWVQHSTGHLSLIVVAAASAAYVLRTYVVKRWLAIDWVTCRPPPMNDSNASALRRP